MPIRHTQLSYDEALWDRKKRLMDALGSKNVTFSKLLVAGIESMEAKLDTTKKALESKLYMYDNGELVDPPKKEPPQEPKKDPAAFLFILDKPPGVLERVFDVFMEEEGMWVETPLPMVPDNAMFRIREDNEVVAFRGKKHFYKNSDPMVVAGVRKLLIYPVEYKKEVNNV